MFRPLPGACSWNLGTDVENVCHRRSYDHCMQFLCALQIGMGHFACESAMLSEYELLVSCELCVDTISQCQSPNEQSRPTIKERKKKPLSTR